MKPCSGCGEAAQCTTAPLAYCQSRMSTHSSLVLCSGGERDRSLINFSPRLLPSSSTSSSLSLLFPLPSLHCSPLSCRSSLPPSSHLLSLLSLHSVSLLPPPSPQLSCLLPSSCLLPWSGLLPNKLGKVYYYSRVLLVHTIHNTRIITL